MEKVISKWLQNSQKWVKLATFVYPDFNVYTLLEVFSILRMLMTLGALQYY